MALSHDIISQFAKIVNSDKKQSTETTLYGTVVDEFGHVPGDKYKDENGEETDYVIGANGCKYFKPDGSDQLIPITDMDEDPAKTKENSVTSIDYGDRTSVLVKNHTATVTGNISSPSTNSKEVDGKVEQAINKFDIIVADQVQAAKVYAEQLTADKANVGDLNAANAKITELETEKASVKDLEATNAEIDNLKATKIDADVVEADYAKISDLDATNAEVDNISGNLASFNTTTTEKLTAIDAIIKDLDAESLNAKYANIDFANIGEAAIEKLFNESGIIKDLIVSEGKITGELVGVTIKGDLIEANTLKADKLVVKGEDGLYYKLNIDGLNNVSTTQASKFILLETKPDDWENNYKDYYVISDNNYIHVDNDESPTWQSDTYYKLNTTYESGLDGTVIVANSITAEKIAVDDLVAFGATIGRFHIDDNKDSEVGAIYSGVKSSFDNTTRGIYMDTDGQFAIGDDGNYIKFGKDSDGNYKLDISTVNKLTNDIDKLGLSGRNLLRNSDREVTSDPTNPNRAEFVPYADIAPIFDKYGLVEYTLSFDIKSADTLNEDTVLVYCINSETSKHYIGNNYIPVTTEYTRHSITFTPYIGDETQTESRLCFFGTFKTGNVPFVKNVKIEKGNEATEWCLAPEDTATYNSLNDATNDINQTIKEHVSAITNNADAISLSVSTLEASTNDKLDDLNNSVVTLRKDVNLLISDDSVDIEIQKIKNDGVEKVDTGTGFRFDIEGMTVDKDDADTNTKITETGMVVKSKITNQPVLTANKHGVDAENLHATTYLIISNESRFETYINDGKKRTACFWIGE